MAQLLLMETGECCLCEKMGEQAFKILEAGGIKPMMRERMKKRGRIVCRLSLSLSLEWQFYCFYA